MATRQRKKPDPLSVVERVELDLGRLPNGLASCGLAGAALVLARQLDSPRNSATSKSMCAKALLDVMDRLRELAPPDRKKDAIDDLSDRRAKRLAGGSGAKALRRS